MALTVLHPDTAAALTRYVLGLCLGRGSLGLCSRSVALQTHQPRRHEPYIQYQWKKLRQFLPAIKPVVFVSLEDKSGVPGSGQYRLRCSSRYFRPAYNLLFSTGKAKISSEVLELLGAEAMAMLWADRGWVTRSNGNRYCAGRLNLSRFDYDDAALIAEWIQRLTGATCEVRPGPRSLNDPMLAFNGENTRELLKAMSRTWMAQTPCLLHKFKPADDRRLQQARSLMFVPGAIKRPAQLQQRERLAPVLTPGPEVPGVLAAPPLIRRQAPQAPQVPQPAETSEAA